MRAWVVAAVFLSVGCSATASTSVDDPTRASYRAVFSSTYLDPETLQPSDNTVGIYHSHSEESPDYPNVAPNNGTGYVGLDHGFYNVNYRLQAGGDILAEYVTTFADSRRYLFTSRTASDGTITLSQHLDNRHLDPGVSLRFINCTTDGAPFIASVVTGGTTVSTQDVVADATTVEASDPTQTVDLDAPGTLSVAADVPLVASVNGASFATPALPSHSTVNIVVNGLSTAPSMVLVLPVDETNATPTQLLPAGARALIVDNVPGDPGFGTLVPETFPLTLGARSGEVPTFEAATTNIVIASPDPASPSGLTFLSYKDATTTGSIRVVNALVGSAAPDVSFGGTAIVYTDLVFSASATQPVPDPTAVTSVTVTDTSATFTLAPVLTSTTRYLLLTGDVTATPSLTTLSFDGTTWTAATVPTTP